MSPDFWNNWLSEQLYYFLLIDSFSPSEAEKLDLASVLSGGQAGAMEAIHRLCLTSSFDRRNPGPDTFVTVVLEQVAGKNVQKNRRDLEAGKKIYEGVSGSLLGQRGNSQADVVNIAFSQEASTQHFVSREYARLLRTTPSRDQVIRDAERLAEDPLSYCSIVEDWLESGDYEERLRRREPMPNRLFVRSLFVDLFDRPPSFGEEQQFRSALDGMADSRPLRGLIARILLDSGKTIIPEKDRLPEPSLWVEEVFEKLLGREPLPHELSAFLDVLAVDESRTSSIIHSIISHPEYQSW